jgi:hypothetical protein
MDLDSRLGLQHNILEHQTLHQHGLEATICFTNNGNTKLTYWRNINNIKDIGKEKKTWVPKRHGVLNKNLKKTLLLK